MVTVTKRYLDKAGLEYLVTKIKNEYHKVTQSSVSDNTDYPVLLGGTASPNGTSLTANYDSGLKFNPSTDTLTSPKIYQGDNQVVSAIKINSATTALKNDNGTVDVVTGIRYDAIRDSIAEGLKSESTATGYYSHAEGLYTNASDYASHAEGLHTNASDYASHAEGLYTNASSSASHAEGYNTNASGIYSHAEGSVTKASGDCSHAEGYYAKASGFASHTEGYNTIGATGATAQHVGGMYNTVDTSALFVIGNGASSEARSNAMVVGRTGLMKIGAIQANNTSDQSSNKYFATDGTIQSISTIQGQQGATGPTGPKGATGLQGITGKQGVAAGFANPEVKTTILSENEEPTVSVNTSGDNTSKKFTFTFGLPKGYQGATGIQGPRGITGIQGPQGVQGKTGAEGTKGVQGKTGPQGDQGPRGITGIQGPQGVQGKTGAEGTKGVQGKTGAEGTKGVQGKTGAEGTKGVQGKTGPQGDQGPRGITGIQGPQGVQGKTGAAGFIASVDRSNFTSANWATYGTIGHQDSWNDTTIPTGMTAGDLFIISGCATDTGDGYQLVYRYDPTYLPTNTTLRGTCVSSHVIAKGAQLGTANAGTNISISNNKINADGYVYDSTKKSFAEGVTGTTATGNYSHAEGYIDFDNEIVEITCTILTDAQKTAVQNKYGIYFTYCELNDNIDDEHGSQYWIYSDENCTNSVGKILVSKYIFASDTGEYPSGDYFNLTSGTLTNGTTYYLKRTCGALEKCSHAEGYNTTASGIASHAEGYNTTASDDCSHAEGDSTTAPGCCSHAEGQNTTASSYCSHAEGQNTTASDDCSHAEGDSTTASGCCSHAEGDSTTASGCCSHAEGYYAKASGFASHTEGYNTIGATGATAQHVGGMYNTVDTSALFVIGNGGSTTARSNAMVVGRTGLMKIGAIQANNTSDQSSNKYFATDGTIQSISTSSDGGSGLPYSISIPTYDIGEQNYSLDVDTHSFTITNNDIYTDGVFTMTSVNPSILCKTDLTAEQLTQKYKNCFLCHLVQRRNGNFVYWRIVDSTFETYPLWMPKKLTGGEETLQFGYVRDLMNQACKFTSTDITIDDALIKSMFFGSQNEEANSWHQAGALKNFINYGSDDRYIQLRGMERTLNERNKMREDATQRTEVNAENILRQYSNGYSINVKIAIFGTVDSAITNNTTDTVLLSNVINGKYYIKKVTKSPKDFAFGFAEEP